MHRSFISHPFKNVKLWQIVVGSLLLIITCLALSYFWLMSLVDRSVIDSDIKLTQPQQIEYLQPYLDATYPKRGKILAVVTSTATMGDSGKPTGYELTELSRAYYVFSANGFEVDIASPQGGTPPVVIDNEDMGYLDYAFLNDARAQAKVTQSLSIDAIDASDYEAVYFVGGKGAMFDFPENKSIQSLTKAVYQAGGVVSAVCHGPAALVNVELDGGKPLVAEREVSSFTNEEELFLIADAEQIFPFLLQDKLEQRGARFSGGAAYLEHVSVDGRLVTGQNPWSVWSVAEAVVEQLGYTPTPRPITAQERSIDILVAFEKNGHNAAVSTLKTYLNDHTSTIDRNLILMHAIVKGMKYEWRDMISLLEMVETAKFHQRAQA